MRTGITLAITALMFIPPPVRSAKPDELPQECAESDVTNTGRPVMFPPRDGLSMGISTLRPTFEVSDPIVIYVWTNNQTDDEKVLMSCAMWWDWGIVVYDSQWHAIKTHTEQEEERRPQWEQGSKICGRNKLLRIPPHSCGPLQDVGDVKIDLRSERDLPPGTYFVTEKGLTLPLRGLQIVVQDKNRNPDEQDDKRSW